MVAKRFLTWLSKAKFASQAFEDEQLEAVFLSGRQREADRIILGDFMISLSFAPVRIWYIARTWNESSFLTHRFALVLLQHLMTLVGSVALILQVKRKVWGRSWEKLLLSILFTLCIAVLCQYHPRINECEPHDEACLHLVPVVMGVCMVQMALATPCVCRYGLGWLAVMGPALAIGTWGLAEWLLPAFRDGNFAGDSAIMLVWMGPVLAGQALGLGYLNERSTREVVKQLHDKTERLKITEAKLQEDSRLGQGMLRLAMSRFEVVLGLRQDFSVGMATANADELLGTHVQGIQLENLFLEEDVRELKQRLSALANPLATHEADRIERGRGETVTMTVQLKYGHGAILRVVAAALTEPNMSGSSLSPDADLIFLLGLEKAGLDPPLPVPVHDHVSPMRMGHGRPRSKSPAGNGTPAQYMRNELPERTENERRSSLLSVGSSGRPGRARNRVVPRTAAVPQRDPEFEARVAFLQGTWAPATGSGQIVIIGDEVTIGKTKADMRCGPNGEIMAAGGVLTILNKDVITWQFEGKPEPTECRRVVYAKAGVKASPNPEATTSDVSAKMETRTAAAAKGIACRPRQNELTQVISSILPGQMP